MHPPVLLLHGKKIFECIVLVIEVGSNAAGYSQPLRPVRAIVAKKKIQSNNLQYQKQKKNGEPPDKNEDVMHLLL